MAVEFITRDENYKGPRMMPSGTVLTQAHVFVDHLPYDFLAEQYKPYLVKDRYSHRPRYVIDINITVRAELLVLVGAFNNGGSAINNNMAQFVYNMSIERDGLDILLNHDNYDYQGVLHPIPELADAQRQHKRRLHFGS